MTASGPFAQITVDQVGSIATIRLNRPERANALSRACLLELRSAFEWANSAGNVRVVLLKAAGRSFSSGADLGESGRASIVNRDLGESLEQFVNPLLETMLSSSKPIVAAVNGIAVGAGCNLALACDIVIAARSARFVQPFARYGLALDTGGSYFLPRLVGSARASAIALLAEDLLAESAKEMGLIWDVVDDEQMESATATVASRLASLSPAALSSIKRQLRASLNHSVTEQLALERDLQREAGRSKDFSEGVAAFREKRAPMFADPS